MSQGPDRRLVYTTDERGNRVPDFSSCGYMAAAQPIPDVPVRIAVPAVSGDATRRIQKALDYVASLPADANGIRGAVLLEKGVHYVSGSLKVAAGGVVLRGSGMRPGGTVLLGNDRGEFIVYCRSPGSIRLDAKATTGSRIACWIDPKDGSLLEKQKLDQGAGSTELKNPLSGPAVVWVIQAD